MAMHYSSTQNSYQRRDFGNPVVQIVLLLIVIVLFSWFILLPKVSKTLTSRSALKASQNQLAKIESDQRELNQLVSKLKSSPEDVALVDEALPLNDRTSKTYVLLDSLVKSSGMTSTLINADDSKDVISAGDKATLQNPYQPGRSLHTITITASISGTMEQFRNLLQLIESNGRVLDVQSVDMIGGESETKFRLVVKAYTYENVKQ